MTTDSNALDQLEKLFALKKAGILTDAEFEAEKARVLNAGRPESRDGADTSDNLEATHCTEIAPERRRYFASTSAKAIAVLVLFLTVGLLAWQAARNDWFKLPGPSSSPTSSSAEADGAEQLPQADMLPDETAAVDAVFSWTLNSDNGSLMALYGGERTSASVTLDCLTSERQIEYAEFDVEKPPIMDGRIAAGRGQGYPFSGFYNDDDEYAYFGFRVPADSELWTELANGDSDLIISVDGVKPYNLPRSPVLSEFISKCRAKL